MNELKVKGEKKEEEMEL